MRSVTSLAILAGAILWAGYFGARPVAQAAALPQIRRAVYKVRAHSERPDFRAPWRKRPQGSGSGSAFYIGDGRIMTNAHVVAGATYLTVQRDGESQPRVAEVDHVAHDADLAILSVEDPEEAFSGVAPLRFGSIPRLRTPVSTVGFPQGGEQISVTQGIVSRLGYRRYVHDGHSRHLQVQVDAAINSGNSGGPVVQGGRVVGVAFQASSAAENTGYIIPVPVIQRFLGDVEDGRYDGHPEDGLTVRRWTVMNPSTAAFYGLSKSDGGVKISHVASWAPTAGVLQAGDIVLEIANQQVGVDGKVELAGERVDFRALFDLRQMGDVIPFRIAREGEKKTVHVTVEPSDPHHMPRIIHSDHPRYFVFAGLVFTALSHSYLKTWGNKWYRKAPLLLRYLNSYSEYEPDLAGKREIIVLASRLPHRINAYADEHVNQVVTHLDEKPLKSLDQLRRRLTDSKKPYAVFEFWRDNDPLILPMDKADAYNRKLEKTYGVEPPASLKSLWPVFGSAGKGESK